VIVLYGLNGGHDCEDLSTACTSGDADSAPVMLSSVNGSASSELRICKADV
jgi:hypothetical protein